MKNEKKNLTKNFLRGTLVAGAFLSVAALSAAPQTSNLFDYSIMGSGSEVRSELLHTSSPDNMYEAKCGEEKSEAKTEETKAGESKTEEAKCGEGKCGEKATETKSETTTQAKTETKSESKSEEAKCGEGKCGNVE